jgi:DNA-binding response OmpR family regulator
MRILIVDDSPTAAAYLRKKLVEMGHEVLVAKSGREAWQHLESQFESLVITDWIMPELSGPELCRRIRARGSTPYTYVILLTVKDLRKDRLEGLQAGADDFLTKPVDSVELVTALRTAERILSAQADLQRRVTELERNRAGRDLAAAGPAE